MLFRSEDHKRREEVDARNTADSAIYNAEKTLKELGDKIEATDRSTIESAIATLKDSMSRNDVEAMKTDADALQQEFYKVSEKIYKQNPPPEQPDSGAADMGDDGFKDAGGDSN